MKFCPVLFLLFKILIISFLLVILEDFLSLFYWTLFSYERNWLKENLKKVYFNPYSTGFYSFIKTEYWRRWRWYAVSILILLDSLLLYTNLYWFRWRKCSFNPYSIGFYSFIIAIVNNKGGVGKFQSLFYWILFSSFMEE